MASYFSNFEYMGKNSADMGFMVVAFDVDNGLTDTYLGMEQIYTNNYDGTKRILYGAKYNNVTTITISIIKSDGKELNVQEARSALRWLTGARTASWLNLYDENKFQCAFLCTNEDVQQYKLDGRTIGFTITFLSVSPYAYSDVQRITCSFGYALKIDENGVLYKDQSNLSVIKPDGVLANGSSAMFKLDDENIIYLDNRIMMQIDNQSDDLYSYVYMDVKFTNKDSEILMIKNKTLYEASGEKDGLTEITNITANEVITLKSEQFITSSSKRSFGNDFNFVWPKLMPGINTFIIGGDDIGNGSGDVELTYRYPIKIGNFTMNLVTSGTDLSCGKY